MSDEREGRPSASGMERLALCPGSWNASKGIEEASNEHAVRGNRIHSLIAGEDVENHTAEETDIANQCERLAGIIVLQHMARPMEDCTEVWRENRIWTRSGNEPLWSGKPDLVVIYGKRAVIIDFKTGRGEVEHAANNKQLRALAVLIDGCFDGKLENILVAVVQPLASQSMSLCDYTKADIELARVEIRNTIEEALLPDAKRVAGEAQCKYCPAKSRCPEANGVVTELSVPQPGITMLASLELSVMLDRCKQAEVIIDALRDEAKRRLEAQVPVEGWELKPGAIRETITHPEAVFFKFSGLGGNIEQFMSSISVNKSKLSDAMKVVTGTKGKELEVLMDGLLEGCTESKSIAPSLVKTKTKKG